MRRPGLRGIVPMALAFALASGCKIGIGSLDLDGGGGGGSCVDLCSPEGSTRCEGNRTEAVCARASTGCLWWNWTPCDASDICVDGACSAVPASWTAMPVPVDAWDLYGVWGASPTDVFAVGNVILHHDGTGWVTQMSGVNADLRLAAVWGSAGDDVFAVGEGGSILHYDGTGWAPQLSGTTRNLRGVWGTSSRDVFAVGEGIILHWDGAAWSLAHLAQETSFTAIWGDGRGTVLVLGAGPYPEPGDRAYRLSGDAWLPTAGAVSGGRLWGSSSADVYAVGSGDVVYHHDGNAWSPEFPVARDYQHWAVGGSSGSDVFVVGCEGSVLHLDGTTWAAQNSGTAECLTAVWAAAPGEIFVVGQKGTVLRHRP